MSAAGGEQPLTRHRPTGLRTLAALGGLLLVTVLVVGGAWRVTRQQIADNAARQLRAEIATVLPAGLYDNQPGADVVLLDTGSGQRLPVYRARRGGTPVAAVLTALALHGYVGPIRLLIGISADGRVLGVRVTEQAETPGIGDAIQAPESALLGAFAGRSLADPPQSRWALRADGGDFDAIAGATVSSRAVVSGVRQAVEYVAAHRDEVFAPPAVRNAP